jgi:hypothetical protein
MMILAQTLPEMATPQTMTRMQHTILAYGVAIALLWGYAAWLFLAHRRARRNRQAQE